MPKSQMILPEDVRRKGTIEFTPIPMNQYDRTVRQELAHFSCEDLKRIWRDMAVIRAFETMLNEVKLRGTFRDLRYEHRGPAHLSIGQESAAVGMAYLLGTEDHIYGSHRSHGGKAAAGRPLEGIGAGCAKAAGIRRRTGPRPGERHGPSLQGARLQGQGRQRRSAGTVQGVAPQRRPEQAHLDRGRGLAL